MNEEDCLYHACVIKIVRGVKDCSDEDILYKYDQILNIASYLMNRLLPTSILWLDPWIR